MLRDGIKHSWYYSFFMFKLFLYNKKFKQLSFGSFCLWWYPEGIRLGQAPSSWVTGAWPGNCPPPNPPGLLDCPSWDLEEPPQGLEVAGMRKFLGKTNQESPFLTFFLSAICRLRDGAWVGSKPWSEAMGYMYFFLSVTTYLTCFIPSTSPLPSGYH